MNVIGATTWMSLVSCPNGPERPSDDEVAGLHGVYRGCESVDHPSVVSRRDRPSVHALRREAHVLAFGSFQACQNRTRGSGAVFLDGVKVPL